MEYVSIQEIADKWEMSKRRVQVLCKEGRIEGAKMIGNMWIIPENLSKPYDARRKMPIYQEKRRFSTLRTDLKSLLKNMYIKTSKINLDAKKQRDYVLAALSAALIQHYTSECEYNIEDYFRVVYRELGNVDYVDEAKSLLVDAIEYVNKYKDDKEVDNVVSWAYQYSNKLQSNNTFSKTQFFTENYMIEFLISHIDELKNAEKIVDPCCGGGNFLLECCEILCKEAPRQDYKSHVLNVVNKLYGYDIDSGIAMIAVINIKLKVLSILNRYKNKVDFLFWNQIHPNVFKSVSVNVGGGLDCDIRVVHVINGERKTLIKALGNADVVLTNPPFETVKGMNISLKYFMKEKYPLSNCDTCAAFILAIQKLLKINGQCGIVTQNTWMYLQSFKLFRDKILKNYCLNYIVNLGSGAFYDLSGEKANVALTIMKRKGENREGNIKYLDLSKYNIDEKKHALTNLKFQEFLKNEIINNSGFDFTSNNELKEIRNSAELYSMVATPMQGTSTGNAKELIDYFWNHFDDSKWRLVSKGGGYCRWQGLNNCVVKWGQDGEYIKEEKGSAIRNVKYFEKTSMVFSDTGTAGLNVRVIMPNQIFVASGPGIRVEKGNIYAQLAYLNSRIATFYIRQLTPKITIAAGYIGKLPICEEIYNSVVLEKNAKLCIELKQKFLKTRPMNCEYNDSYLKNFSGDIMECAMEWFKYDLKNELLKLEIESQIDSYILNAYHLSQEERNNLKQSIGSCAYDLHEEKKIEVSKLDTYFDKLLDDACTLKRSRVSKTEMGTDGVLEYAAKEFGVSPEWLIKTIILNTNKFEKVKLKYAYLILHNEILCFMKYNTKNGIVNKIYTIDELASYIKGKYIVKIDIAEWISNKFMELHKSIFKNSPFLEMNKNTIMERFKINA